MTTRNWSFCCLLTSSLRRKRRRRVVNYLTSMLVHWHTVGYAIVCNMHTCSSENQASTARLCTHETKPPRSNQTFVAVSLSRDNDSVNSCDAGSHYLLYFLTGFQTLSRKKLHKECLRKFLRMRNMCSIKVD